MTAKCPRCQEEQPEGTKFCMSCGARFSYEQKRVTGAEAFAATLATDLGVSGGSGTPRGVPAAAPPPSSSSVAAAPPVALVVPPSAATPFVPVVPPSAGTTPPAFVATPGALAAPPQGEDRSVVIATVAGKLVGLDAQTGIIAWEHAIEAGTPQLVVGAGLVLAAVGQSLYCCEYRTGRPMWRATLSAPSPRVTMVVEPDRVYAFGAGIVDAFDHAGRKVWTRPILPGATASGAIGLPGNVSQADRD